MGRMERRQAAQMGRAVNQATPYSIAAPVGGLNSRDALANMPETDAILIDNLFCQPTWVEVREGHTTLATFAGNCETLMAYAALGANPNELFAAVNSGNTTYSIYRVDNAGGGTVGAPVVGGSGNTIQAITSTQYDYAQYGTTSADVLMLVNGVDQPLLWDGSAWHSLTITSTPYALTGSGVTNATLASLNMVVVYKQRMWFVQAGTFNVYYLSQNTFAGALTLLNVGSNFKLGGFLQTVITVSIDNSAGTNDYIAFISNQGEVIMFQGYDPASVSTWSVSAHFRIGAPVGLGRRAWQKVGMDALIVCQDGFLLLSQAMLTDRTQTNNPVSDKIRFGVNQDMQLYSGYVGWQVLLYPAGNKIIVSVPTSPAFGASFWYVMNTITGAWSTFGRMMSPLNGFCLENFNNQLYYGTSGSVEMADNGTTSDNGQPVTASVKVAFSYMGEKGNLKTWTMCQPIFSTSGTLSVVVTLNVDFDTTAPTGSIPVSSGTSAAWGSLWTTPTYWAENHGISKSWIGLAGCGYCAALNMRFAANDISVQWQSTNFLFQQGGVFYGR